MTPQELQEQKDKWTRIVEQNIHGVNHRTGRERLIGYIGSLVLGKDFNETAGDYFARSGYTEFIAWAMEQV